MVNSVVRHLQEAKVEVVEVPKEGLNWSTVSLSEVVERDKRLEASTFNIDRKHALQQLEQCNYNLVTLSSEEGGLKDCFYGPRSKRNYLSKTDEMSIGFLGSAEMLDINPNPVKFVSPDNPMVENLSLNIGTILVSRSGTIGNVTLVNETLKKFLVSEHAIRVIVERYPGFVYTYLKTETAQNLLHAEKFGSVILEIEPDSLKNMLIPDPPMMLKKKIHDLVIESYKNRDDSNRLINEATKLLIDELELPPIEEMHKEASSYSDGINSFSTKLSNLNGRLEGSYHVPIADVIEEYISQKAGIVQLNNEKITEKIILPGRFKRVYVTKGNGKIFLGGKEIGQLDPANKKYLSLSHHSDRIKNELLLKKNMVLVTCSGTIGKVSIVPQHWENWAVNQHVLRVINKTPYYGLVYAWLNSEYGKALILRQVYGSVVDEITDKQIGEVIVPLFKDESIIRTITKLIDKANDLRYQAYKQEQKAIDIMNKGVLSI